MDGAADLPVQCRQTGGSWVFSGGLALAGHNPRCLRRWLFRLESKHFYRVPQIVRCLPSAMIHILVLISISTFVISISLLYRGALLFLYTERFSSNVVR